MMRQSSPDNKSFWDHWAGQYDPFMRGSAPLYDRIAQRMKKRLTRDMYVLECAGVGLRHRHDLSADCGQRAQPGSHGLLTGNDRSG